MKALIGFIGVLVGIALGIYMGLWVCFIGGAMDIIQEIIDGDKGLDLSVLAWGILKMMIAGLVGWVSAVVVIAPSAALLKS